MSDEPALLRALAADRRDDTRRLAYADWLQERGDVGRAEYLRLQVELVRTWWYDRPCPELFARLAELAKGIDPEWLAAVRRCTTPAPPVDVEVALPELRGRAKTAVRLHPRPGKAAADASKIGGLFLWPQDEPWPRCDEHDLSLVTALQLRKEDAPELGFPDGTDLFQLLWCPEDYHAQAASGYKAPRVFWRARNEVTAPRKRAPGLPTDRGERFWDIPKPCVLHPERATEYPDAFELADYQARDANPALRAAVAAASRMRVGHWSCPDSGSRLYQVWLSTAEGVKVGGYPDWVQDPDYPACSCGNPMEHLLSFGSWEFDGVTWGRWLPVEDRPILAGASYEARQAVQNAHGCSFGDAGNMYLFVCRRCAGWPVRSSMQCS